jgi:2,3-bisphosphoglycerate-independent phosphoglycerate mutase
MHDYSAAHIKDEDAASLIHYLNKKMGAKAQFIHGLSYRNLMLIKEELQNVKTVPPHDIMGASIKEHLPKEEELLRIMDEAAFLLSKHPLSRECSANAIWLWGQGKKPSLPKFERVWGKKGAMVAEVALVKGLGKLAGLFCPDVEGATGYYDTAYDKIWEEALKLLQEHDFVLVHVEAPDEAGHEGNIYQKIKAIEQIDRWIISPLIKECKELRLLFLFDHLTPVSVRTHVAEPICYLLYEGGREGRGVPKFCEKHVKGAPIKGEGLIKLLFS